MAHMAIYFSGGNAYPGIMPDPSNAGGVCRLRCDSQRDPWACCRTKANLPSCKDADCSGAVYTGTRATAYTPGTTAVAYQNWPYPIIQPPPGSDCKAWAPCSTTANPKQCCQRKPPGCDTWCTSYGYDNPLAPLLGGDCRTWPPCQYNPSPHACCANKPPGCDPWCASSPAPPAFNKPTYPPTGDCRNWPRCSASANPQACCQAKPPGCDEECRDYRFVRGQAAAVVTPTFVGSSFRNNEATDKLYGIDKGYVGDIAM